MPNQQSLFTFFCKLTSSDVIALSSAVVAFLAMIATFYQAHLARKHNRLSVKPHLDYFLNTYSNSPMELGIVNSGLGPAIVEDLIFHFDGKEHHAKDGSIQTALNDSAENLTYGFNMVLPTTPLAVGERIRFIWISNSNQSPELHNSALGVIKRLGFTLTYKSMYDETFSLIKDVETKVI